MTEHHQENIIYVGTDFSKKYILYGDNPGEQMLIDEEENVTSYADAVAKSACTNVFALLSDCRRISRLHPGHPQLTPLIGNLEWHLECLGHDLMNRYDLSARFFTLCPEELPPDIYTFTVEDFRNHQRETAARQSRTGDHEKPKH